MKILELTRSFYPSLGGMEKFVSDRLKIYEHLGYDYRVITTTHSEKQLSGAEKLENVNYLPSLSPYGVVPSLSKMLEKTDYDILSVNQLTYYYSWQAIKKARKEGKRIILTPHFHFHTDKHKIIKSIHNKFIVPQILNSVDKIICFTKYETDYWESFLPSVKEKTTVIPHYFSSSEIEPKQIRDYGKFLLFIGRGEKNKRIDLLIKAFDKVDLDYNLVLTVTKDEISTEVGDIIEKNKNIHLLGRISEEKKQNLLFSCSALVLPTDFEAFGIVNFEASYYSKPLLLSELQVFKNILNEKGIIYFENNLQSIKDKIEKFFQLSEETKNVMGKINFNNLKKYSFEIISEKYLKLFKELNLP